MSLIQIGKVTQQGLICLNPLQPIIWWKYGTEVTDDMGIKTYSYLNISLTARVQPVSHDLMFKNKLEFGQNYKRFFVLLDDVQTIDRGISNAGDYFQWRGEYWRVMRIPNEFLTGWQEIIAQQSNHAPGAIVEE